MSAHRRPFEVRGVFHAQEDRSHWLAAVRYQASLAGVSLMRDVLSWLRHVVLGAEHPPPVEEESYPRDATGQPDLTRFTRPVAHYAGYIEDCLQSADAGRFGSHTRLATRRHTAEVG